MKNFLGFGSHSNHEKQKQEIDGLNVRLTQASTTIIELTEAIERYKTISDKKEQQLTEKTQIIKALQEEKISLSEAIHSQSEHNQKLQIKLEKITESQDRLSNELSNSRNNNYQLEQLSNRQKADLIANNQALTKKNLELSEQLKQLKADTEKAKYLFVQAESSYQSKSKEDLRNKEKLEHRLSRQEEEISRRDFEITQRDGQINARKAEVEQVKVLLEQREREVREAVRAGQETKVNLQLEISSFKSQIYDLQKEVKELRQLQQHNTSSNQNEIESSAVTSHTNKALKVVEAAYSRTINAYKGHLLNAALGFWHPVVKTELTKILQQNREFYAALDKSTLFPENQKASTFSIAQQTQQEINKIKTLPNNENDIDQVYANLTRRSREASGPVVKPVNLNQPALTKLPVSATNSGVSGVGASLYSSLNERRRNRSDLTRAYSNPHNERKKAHMLIS